MVAARREYFEETGATVRILCPLLSLKRSHETFFFLGQLEQGVPTPASEEHALMLYARPRRALELPLGEGTAVLLQCLLRLSHLSWPPDVHVTEIHMEVFPESHAWRTL